MTKTEKIKEAYGEYYNESLLISEHDGTVPLSKFSGNIPSSFEIVFENVGIKYVRPIALRSIENNFGWIKIENESDLPDDDDKLLYEVCLFEDGIFKRIYEVFSWQEITRIWEGTAQFYAGKISHYKAIENSKPPIY